MARELGVQLQIAMAFGQGAGRMLATPEALEHALSEQAALVRRAITDWEESQYPFIELARTTGQMAAAHAVSRSKTVIETVDVDAAIRAALGVCPCFTKLGMTKP
jgi:hypothetical protein